MSLSLRKLEKILAKYNFVVNKYYYKKSSEEIEEIEEEEEIEEIISHRCIYLELIYIQNAEHFLLYIPPEYTFNLDTNISNSYELIHLDIHHDQNQIENKLINDKYTNLFIEEQDDTNQLLENHYNKSIDLKNIPSRDNTNLVDIHKQMNRIKKCTEHLAFKPCVLFKNYLCTILPDNNSIYYSIKSKTYKSKKQLFVSINLTYFFSKIEHSVHHFLTNLLTIRKGIYEIIDINHNNHIQLFNSLVSKQHSLSSLSNISNKRDVLETYLTKSLGILKNVNKAESNILEKLDDLSVDKSSNAQEILNLNNGLINIHKHRANLFKILLEIRLNIEDHILSIDKIMFDNNVIMKQLSNNFNMLDNIVLELS